VVAQVGEELGAGLDEILIVAVPLLGLLAVGAVVRGLRLLALAHELGVVALEQVELPRDHVTEPASPQHAPRLISRLGLLVRTWNVFHGNAVPPERRAFLEDMLRLATADGPDVVCLQELPVWSLAKLEEWSGMRAFGAVAARPLLASARLGGAITELNHGLLRSALTGQANAILLGHGLRPLADDAIVLNPHGFRRARARELDLDWRVRLAWAKERRVCQAVRADAGGRLVTVANTHCSSVPDRRCQDGELLRAAVFADALAEPGDTLVLAGDFNTVVGESKTLEQLAGPDWGLSEPVPGLDQVLVRGAKALRPTRWPEERRRLAGRLLSDHAPVETMIE
jgi:endonuclease/exonuclease/phosphatase family metal-dependent hydrolase